MASSLNRCHSEARPQIELAADDVRVSVRRICQPFILAAFSLVPPPVAKWPGNSFSFSCACFNAVCVLDLGLYLLAVPVL